MEEIEQSCFNRILWVLTFQHRLSSIGNDGSVETCHDRRLNQGSVVGNSLDFIARAVSSSFKLSPDKAPWPAAAYVVHVWDPGLLA